MAWNDLKKAMPTQGFVEEYEIYRRTRPTVTIVVVRTLTDPTLFRNSDSERAETQTFNSRMHAQLNAEKFVSKERLTGLNLCRRLDKDQDIICAKYTYNEPLGNIEDSQNADLITYGLAGTVSGSTFSQKSRIIEGYTYGLEPYNLVNRETHNALYESGTMENEEGKQSQALFNPVKVQPFTHFVHFITLEAGTPEMLMYVLYNILNTGNYGAREARTGRNMRNEVVGLITSSGNSCLSCGEFLMEFGDELHDGEYTREVIMKSIKEYIDNHKRSDWKIYYDEGSGFTEADKKEKVTWLENLIIVANDKSEAAPGILTDVLRLMRAQGLHVVQKHELEGKTVEISNGRGKGKVVKVAFNGDVTVEVNGTWKTAKCEDIKVVAEESDKDKDKVKGKGKNGSSKSKKKASKPEEESETKKETDTADENW